MQLLASNIAMLTLSTWHLCCAILCQPIPVTRLICYLLISIEKYILICFRSDLSRGDDRPHGLHPESKLAWTVSGEHRVYMANHAGAWTEDSLRYSRDSSGGRGSLPGLTGHAENWCVPQKPNLFDI